MALRLVVEGLPIGDLPRGARLRVGATALLELHGSRGSAAATDAPGLVEGGETDLIAADVVEGGVVAPDDPVTLEAVTVPLTDMLDLHSFRPEEIPKVVAEYLDEALRAGFREVRLVHGRGHGVQRAAVRRVLAETPGVTEFVNAPPTRGGWGATVVRLRAGNTPSG